MANVRPKRFVARTNVEYGGVRFTAGQEVPHGRILQSLLAFGDRFVIDDRKTPTTQAGDAEPTPEETTNG